MATKVVKTNLLEEVLSILKEWRGNADFLNISVLDIQEGLKERIIAFTAEELSMCLNNLTNYGQDPNNQIEFKYFTFTCDVVDVMLEYPARTTTIK